MAEISDLPMHHDIDADYTPQYVRLARILRDKIESGEYERGDALPACDLAHEHGVSVRVAWNALAMLAANRYAHRPGDFKSYRVISPPNDQQQIGYEAGAAGKGRPRHA
jgi:DNA-binding GntR family transcriptional regulator